MDSPRQGFLKYDYELIKEFLEYENIQDRESATNVTLERRSTFKIVEPCQERSKHQILKNPIPSLNLLKCSKIYREKMRKYLVEGLHDMGIYCLQDTFNESESYVLLNKENKTNLTNNLFFPDAKNSSEIVKKNNNESSLKSFVTPYVCKLNIYDSRPRVSSLEDYLFSQRKSKSVNIKQPIRGKNIYQNLYNCKVMGKDLPKLTSPAILNEEASECIANNDHCSAMLESPVMVQHSNNEATLPDANLLLKIRTLKPQILNVQHITKNEVASMGLGLMCMFSSDSEILSKNSEICDYKASTEMKTKSEDNQLNVYENSETSLIADYFQLEQRHDRLDLNENIVEIEIKSEELMTETLIGMEQSADKDQPDSFRENIDEILTVEQSSKIRNQEDNSKNVKSAERKEESNSQNENVILPFNLNERVSDRSFDTETLTLIINYGKSPSKESFQFVKENYAEHLQVSNFKELNDVHKPDRNDQLITMEAIQFPQTVKSKSNTKTESVKIPNIINDDLKEPIRIKEINEPMAYSQYENTYLESTHKLKNEIVLVDLMASSSSDRIQVPETTTIFSLDKSEKKRKNSTSSGVCQINDLCEKSTQTICYRDEFVAATPQYLSIDTTILPEQLKWSIDRPQMISKSKKIPRKIEQTINTTESSKPKASDQLITKRIFTKQGNLEQAQMKTSFNRCAYRNQNSKQIPFVSTTSTSQKSCAIRPFPYPRDLYFRSQLINCLTKCNPHQCKKISGQKMKDQFKSN